MTTIFSEHRGTFSDVKEYRTSIGGDIVTKAALEIVTVAKRKSGGRKSLVSWNFMLTFRTIFLPCGYPDSVSADYVQYQIFDTIQAFSSSITGALATEAVFKSVGVGSNEATPLAAALTWLLKSGSGMVGGIAFTWSKGTALDYDNKKWRLFADIVNDAAIFLDLITPLFPSRLVIFVFCLSSIARSLVGICGGATRAAITQHQARNNNSADVSAKDASQETLVNLLSLIVSLILLPVVSGHSVIVWTLFSLFTCLHVFANYRALRALNLEAFNVTRLLFALNRFLLHQRVPTVFETNQNESLVVGFGLKDRDVCGWHIRIGVSLEDALPGLSKRQMVAEIERSNGKPFLIIGDTQNSTIKVILSENICPPSILEAYGRSVIAGHQLNFNNEKTILDPYSDQVTNSWEEFCREATSLGYNLSCALVESRDWRAKWKHS